MIAVIADDLSGAAELAGAALRHGLSAEVQTDFSVDTDADVICVDTDTRSLTAEDAARRVGAIAADIMAARPAWLYKKCDSVLRGPVLAESRAIAAAAGRAKLMVLSANPSRGRIVRGGSYFINGQPLHETAFAHDPDHPRGTSRVAELLGEDLDGVRLPDATCTEDLLQQAGAVGDDTLPVGGAEFFAALLEHRGLRARAEAPELPTDDPERTTLLVCGSASSWARRVELATASGIPVQAIPHNLAAAVRAVRESRSVLVGIGTGLVTHGVGSAELVQSLAQALSGILRDIHVDRLLLEGGATAVAVIRQLGWSRLRACEPCVSDVCALVPTMHRGTVLCIKPGSYPWPASVWPTPASARQGIPRSSVTPEHAS